MKLVIATFCLLFCTISYGQKHAKAPETQEHQFPLLNFDFNKCTNPASEYYYKSLEAKFNSNDTGMTAAQVLYLTKYYAYIKKQNLVLLDSLSALAYKLNESKKYDSAIVVSLSILKECPNNLTAHKEIALAYKKTGNNSLSAKHSGVMVKLLTSVFIYGDGEYEHPFIINNFFEGISIYEAAYRTKPSKMTLMLDKTNRLLGAYYGYSSSVDNILIRYTELSHWKSKLKKGDYIVEKEMDK